MKDANIESQKTLSENEVKDKASDFTTKYFAVYHLQRLSESHPEIIGPETIFTLEGLLKNREFSRQRRGFFLFRIAADALASIIVHSNGDPMADRALFALKNVLAATTGHPHRVSCEALGALPFSIHGPDIKEDNGKDIPRVDWQEILAEKGFKLSSPASFIGRSLVAPLDSGNRLLVFKFARANDSPDSLFREALWMKHVRTVSYSFRLRFDIPDPISMKRSHVFSLKDIPVRSFEKIGLHPKYYAMAFVADKNYFTYPNDFKMEMRFAETEFCQVMFRNAWLLGRLASLGIVHSAPIPLFHNRVQRCRRRDNGIYEWFRAGRLDRWLDSCSYPNIGLTGIRDFEHFISFKGLGRDLYRYIGSHILSLLLVAGSYF
ncbi:MAG: SidJ-related pseudokinase, partial [Thermodesulfobacteriota bacterium]|nr:SidJ-related pseudokinase [Thermodesulfobacteriota bacterium]